MAQDRLRSLINQSKVMLFMKGNPDAPQCGFSATMIDLLRDEGVDFQSFDILQDEEVRQGLKKFSDWPTYPQLYVAVGQGTIALREWMGCMLLVRAHGHCPPTRHPVYSQVLERGTHRWT